MFEELAELSPEFGGVDRACVEEMIPSGLERLVDCVDVLAVAGLLNVSEERFGDFLIFSDVPYALEGGPMVL